MSNQENELNPMYNIQAEQAVLGSIIIERDAGDLLNELALKSSAFSRPSHKVIYEAMQALAADRKPIDGVTLTEYLNSRQMLVKAGGIDELTALANYVPSAGQAKYYADIVKDKALKRAYLVAGERMMEAAKKAEKADDLQTELEKIISDVSAQNEQDLESPNPAQDLADVFADIETRYENAGRGGLSGLATGFKKLNECTDGFQKGDLIILAARPSMGKTALAGNIFTYTAGFKKIPALFVSLEMSKGQLLERFTAATANIECKNIQRGLLNETDFNKLIKTNNDLSKAPLYIVDNSALANINRLEAYARKMKRKTDIQLIIIDYLQLMNAGDKGGYKQENRQCEVSTISRRLKLLALDLQIPIIALSQLSRAVEGRNDKRPMLSDLRESGAIEQDADLVMMLYRQDYYDNQNTTADNKSADENKQAIQIGTGQNDTRPIAELIIAKHRKGSTGTINLVFFKEYCRFDDVKCTKQEEIK